MRNIILSCIRFYQATLSPDHGPLAPLYPYGFCPQHPTCSEYVKTAIEEHGVIIGSLLSIARILRCHPWRRPTQERIGKILQCHPE